MGGGAEEERHTCVVPCLDSIPDRRRHEMASLPIPGELVTEILLRLPTSADIACASAACVSFRRVAAHRSFLRRYRKLHTPPLLGFLDKNKVFHPAIAPHPSASVASAVALAADFSFSFLPVPASDWVVRDIRDGRALLDKPMRIPNSTVVFPEVVVCDPLHRRYLLLPPIASDLATSVEDPIMANKQLCFETFLAPPGCGVEAAITDETSFSVIRMVQCKTRLVAFAFSSNTGEWRVFPSRCLRDLSAGLPPLEAPSFFNSRHHVYGCFYWLTADKLGYKLLLLDTKTMEFSISKAPPKANSVFGFAMVEAGEGTLGMFVVGYSGSHINYFIRQNDDGSSSQWQKVKTISLRFWARLICNMEKYLLLHIGQKRSLTEQGCYTLDTETFQLEKVLKKVLRRRCSNKAVLQAQAQSHHGQCSGGTDAGDLAVL